MAIALSGGSTNFTSTIEASPSANRTVTVPDTSFTVAGTDVAQTFSAAQTFSSDVTLNAQKDLRFADSDSSNWVAFQAPATVSSNVTWTLPAADGTSNQVLATNGSGTLSWTTASSSQWTTSGSDIYYTTGNVGIGTSSPGYALHVAATSPRINVAAASTSFAGFRAANSGGSFQIAIDDSTGSSFLGAAYGRVIYSTDAYPIQFATNGTERARITSGGYFKASYNGTYDSSTGTYHEFVGNAAANPALFIYNNNASFTNYVTEIFSNRNTTNNTYYFLRCRISGTADKLYIADSGNVTNTNGTYGTISDQKLKQDIVDASSQWDDIKNLRFRKYRLKTDVELNPDAKPFLGLIAQEAEIVSPGLVEEQTDRDEEGNDLGTTTKSVKTSILYMKAVKALQEAMERIETLEAQNAAFESRLAALEAN